MPDRTTLLIQYRALQATVRAGLGKPEVTAALVSLLEEAKAFLAENCSRAAMNSGVPGKQYFTFTDGARTSRPVNADLFKAEIDPSALAELAAAAQGPPDSLLLRQSLYSWVLTFCAANDVLFVSDQKKPGTFFEWFVGHLLARRYRTSPRKFTEVASLGMNTRIPTDFVFDLGAGKARIHLPVKTSTRERAIQVWAHQRVLDGLHGQNTFRGILVCVAETNKQVQANSVIEVCVPEQWRLYQGYIAQLHRVYYLDPPAAYLSLGAGSPQIPVKHFSEFFSESDRIVSLA